jgi:hypothetical protein
MVGRFSSRELDDEGSDIKVTRIPLSQLRNGKECACADDRHGKHVPASRQADNGCAPGFAPSLNGRTQTPEFKLLAAATLTLT